MSDLAPINNPCGPLPPLTAFNSWEEAHAAFLLHAPQNGYSLVIAKKQPSAQSFDSVLFRCAKGRNFKSKAAEGVHDTERRYTGTQLTGCPVRVKVKLRNLGAIDGAVSCAADSSDKAMSPDLQGRWVVEYLETQGDTDYCAHNHNWQEKGAFALNRRSALEQEKEGLILSWNRGVRPVTLLTEVREKGLDVAASDIYNLINRHRAEDLDGLTPIQWLLKVTILEIPLHLINSPIAL